MASTEATSRPPIIAAFSADSAAREPVEFGLAASRVTGAPLIVVTVTHGDVATHHALRSSADAPHGAHHEALQHLEREFEQRGDPQRRACGSSRIAARHAGSPRRWTRSSPN